MFYGAHILLAGLLCSPLPTLTGKSQYRVPGACAVLLNIKKQQAYPKRRRSQETKGPERHEWVSVTHLEPVQVHYASTVLAAGGAAALRP